MNNEKKLDTEKLSAKVKAALEAAPKTGELPDSALEAVAGGCL